MKGYLPFTLIFFLFGLTGSNCSQNGEPKTELEKLPPITSSGRYTFGCLVNGNAMVPDNTLDVPASYQFGMLQVTGRVSTMAIHFYLDDSVIKPIPFTASFDGSGHARVSIGYFDDERQCHAETDGTAGKTGTITITRFDRINYIVSGTFSFVLEMPNGCPEFTVTEGRFDTQFIP